MDYNENTNDTKQMNFLDLKRFKHTTFWNNIIMLGDNLDDDLPLNKLSIFNQDIYPIKLNFPMYWVCIEGYIKVNINLEEYLVEKNEIIFILPNNIGYVEEISPNCKLIMHSFEENQSYTPYSFPQTINNLKNCIKRNNRKFKLQEDIIEEILFIHKTIKKKILFNNENNISDILQHYILGIISSITVAIKDIIEKNNHILSRQEQIFYSFIQKVQGNYNKEREVVFYAKELCISPKYLSKIVFESSGKYAKDWIKEYVILAAKALLKSNDYTVQQISYMLNFPNNSFFGKYFKSAVGCSPKKYQETGNSEKNIK